jgi:prepilin peptidase CpaA
MPDITLFAWLACVAAFDLSRRRVPNWLVVAGIATAAGLLALGAHPFGLGWSDAVLGALIAFGALLPFYVLGVMGAGDVKFAGALGLWLGLMPLIPIWLGASLLAGAHALLWVALQRWPVAPRLALALGATGEPRSTRRVPFAAYLAVATLIWATRLF